MRHIHTHPHRIIELIASRAEKRGMLERSWYYNLKCNTIEQYGR